MSDDSGEDVKLTPELLEQLRKGTQEQDIHMTRYEPCLCGKLMDFVQSAKKVYSGKVHGGKIVRPGINYMRVLCKDCADEFADWSLIVCLGCKSLMGFYRPGRQATGFVFERRQHYHIGSCPKCDSDARATPVIEHELFCRENGIKTQMDQDLLQEIEQKILQGKLEADKLRAEFEASKKK